MDVFEKILLEFVDDFEFDVVMLFEEFVFCLLTSIDKYIDEVRVVVKVKGLMI